MFSVNQSNESVHIELAYGISGSEWQLGHAIRLLTRCLQRASHLHTATMPAHIKAVWSGDRGWDTLVHQGGLVFHALRAAVRDRVTELPVGILAETQLIKLSYLF